MVVKNFYTIKKLIINYNLMQFPNQLFDTTYLLRVENEKCFSSYRREYRHSKKKVLKKIVQEFYWKFSILEIVKIRKFCFSNYLVLFCFAHIALSLGDRHYEGGYY